MRGMCLRSETAVERQVDHYESLKASLERCEALRKDWCLDAQIVMAAARKHLETLPRTKTIWCVWWNRHDHPEPAMRPAMEAFAEEWRARGRLGDLLKYHPAMLPHMTGPHEVSA